MPIDRNKPLLDAIAAIYDDVADIYAERTAHDRVRRGTADQERFLAGVPQGGRILDLGFGSGWDIAYFSDLGYEVSGIDISRRQVARVRALSPEARIILGDLCRADEQLPIASYDGVWASASVVHMDRPDAERAFGGMYRLLRSGGVGYVSVKYRADVNAPEVVEKPSISSGGVTKRYVYWLQDDLFAALERAGFEIDDYRYSEMSGGDTFLCVFIHKP